MPDTKKRPMKNFHAQRRFGYGAALFIHVDVFEKAALLE
jgi:hypothetical protein